MVDDVPISFFATQTTNVLSIFTSREPILDSHPFLIFFIIYEMVFFRNTCYKTALKIQQNSTNHEYKWILQKNVEIS